ncbi:MAG TPA: DedA family protein [Terriglobia bacterium]|nr:DedA family protein [Terriglobia bacterium]
MAHHVYITLANFFAHYGYWTIFVTVLVENIGLPAPGDTVVLFGGFVARHGALKLVWTILIAIGAAVLGQCLGFAIGRLGGEPLIQKYRRKLLIPQTRYDRAQEIFLKNAAWAVFIARFIVVLRELAGLLSGVFGFPLSRFLLFNIGGAVVWSVSMSCLGYFLSISWRQLLHFVSRMNILALALFGVAAVIIVWRQWKMISSRP